MQRHWKKDLIWFDLVEIFVIPLRRLWKISRFISILWPKKYATLCAIKNLFIQTTFPPLWGWGRRVGSLLEEPHKWSPPHPCCSIIIPNRLFFLTLVFIGASFKMVKRNLFCRRAFKQGQKSHHSYSPIFPTASLNKTDLFRNL